MAEKTFSIETAKERPGYKVEILNIINDIEKRVKSVHPDALMHKELHEKRLLDSRREIVEFEKVREDVCEAFGVSSDEEHTFFFKSNSDEGFSEQRALRAFFVLIDTLRK